MEDALRHHWVYLKKSDYVVRRDIDQSKFTAAELGLIVKYGAWMEALERQAIKPVTEAQKRFVRVCRGVAQPATPLELAWKKLKESKREEGDVVDVFDTANATDEGSPKLWDICEVCRGSGGGGALCVRCRGTGWADDLRARRNPSFGFAERSLHRDLHPRFSANAAKQAARAT